MRVGLFACVLFLFLAVIVHFNAVNQLETSWLWSIHQWHNPLLDQFALVLAYIGGMPGMLVAMCCLVLACMVAKKKVLAYLMVAGIVGIFVLGWLFKFMFDRARPDVWQQAVAHYGESFPSNHSAYAVVLAGLMMILFAHSPYQRLVVVAGLFWAVAMGVSRVYLGAHFPTDVLGGWSLGVAWLCLLLGCFNHWNFFNHRASTVAGNHEVK